MNAYKNLLQFYNLNYGNFCKIPGVKGAIFCEGGIEIMLDEYCLINSNNSEKDIERVFNDVSQDVFEMFELRPVVEEGVLKIELDSFVEER